ncbi:MAG: TonB C-terminal domain-containing protein [Acidobacteriota bacterium]|nr:TonB C-terminal domain-containing protein [Acidobacteriota bacterium]
MDAVSEVLIARSAKSDGLSSMVGWSAMAHVALVAAVAFVPGAWFGAIEREPEVILQISLGGPIGPADGGLATLGGRTIQQVVETKKAVEPVRPPAAQTPAMIEPTKAPPRKTTPTKTDAKDPRSTIPTKGAEIQKGTAIAETGAKGQGFGLSSGAGGKGGYVDVVNFCCPGYLATMKDQITMNWSSKQGTVAETQMRFVVQRDGRIVDVKVERSSGRADLDYLASRALQLAKLPPLPTEFTGSALPVYLWFEYVR